MNHVAVIGAGSWGTALANHVATLGHAVKLWAYESETVAVINSQRCNTQFLPGVDLHDHLTASADLAAVTTGANIILLVPPSHALRTLCTQLAPLLDAHAVLVCCSKGIETDSGALMSEVLAATLPRHHPTQCTFLSGPSFAKEVAAGEPTAVVIAGTDPQVTRQVQQLLRGDHFMTFAHSDVIGVEIGGALKNVLAIASGIATGIGFGHNARAALISRGLYEMMKIGSALGADPLTFAGLSGIGDLMLTCTGELSRNRAVGEALGRGETLHDILARNHTVAEGVRTAQAVQKIIAEHKISAPICTAVYRILHEGLAPQDAANELLRKPLGREHGSLGKD